MRFGVGAVNNKSIVTIRTFYCLSVQYFFNIEFQILAALRTGDSRRILSLFCNLTHGYMSYIQKKHLGVPSERFSQMLYISPLQPKVNINGFCQYYSANISLNTCLSALY